MPPVWLITYLEYSRSTYPELAGLPFLDVFVVFNQASFESWKKHSHGASFPQPIFGR